MSNRSDQVEAVRAALEAAGELLAYAENGVAVGNVWGKITRSAEIFDESGMPMRVTIIRVVKDDVPNLTRLGAFTAGTETFRYKNVVSDNGISIVIEVGK